MTGERKGLNFDNLDSLDDFQPRPKPAVAPAATKKAVDKTASFPSREQPDDAQINIKAPSGTLDRFRALAKAERYRHGEFLDILMDAYEGRAGDS